MYSMGSEKDASSKNLLLTALTEALTALETLTTRVQTSELRNLDPNLEVQDGPHKGKNLLWVAVRLAINGYTNFLFEIIEKAPRSATSTWPTQVIEYITAEKQTLSQDNTTKLADLDNLIKIVLEKLKASLPAKLEDAPKEVSTPQLKAVPEIENPETKVKVEVPEQKDSPSEDKKLLAGKKRSDPTGPKKVTFLDKTKHHVRLHSPDSGKRTSSPSVDKSKNAIEIKLLDKLPRLDKFLNQIQVRSLVKSISEWDAYSVSLFDINAKHPPKEIFYLETWITLSLLNARFDKERFIRIFENLVNVRDKLFELNYFNAAITIHIILTTDTYEKIIKNRYLPGAWGLQWYQLKINPFYDKLIAQDLDYRLPTFSAKLIKLAQPEKSDQKQPDKQDSKAPQQPAQMPLKFTPYFIPFDRAAAKLNDFLSDLPEGSEASEEYINTKSTLTDFEKLFSTAKTMLAREIIQGQTNLFGTNLSAISDVLAADRQKQVTGRPLIGIEEVDDQYEVSTKSWRANKQYIDFLFNPLKSEEVAKPSDTKKQSKGSSEEKVLRAAPALKPSDIPVISTKEIAKDTVVSERKDQTPRWHKAKKSAWINGPRSVKEADLTGKLEPVKKESDSSESVVAPKPSEPLKNPDKEETKGFNVEYQSTSTRAFDFWKKSDKEESEQARAQASGAAPGKQPGNSSQ